MNIVPPSCGLTRLRQVLLCAVLSAPIGLCSQAGAPPQDPDTTTLNSDGTARITRLIGIPTTLSPEAQAFLKTGLAWAPAAGSAESQKLIDRAREIYPVDIEEKSIGGVKTKVVTPKTPLAANRQRILLCIHGGGFVTDSGSFLESIPIASLTHTTVVAVDYRLAPKFRFPAQVDDVIAVYRELLKTYKPQNIGMYGTSAGAILTAETAARLRQLELPLPAALGFFSGTADFSRIGDSTYYFGVPGLRGAHVPRGDGAAAAYLGSLDEKDPVASPIYANLKGFPPTLCMSGTRDMLLSGTANFHRALLLAGVDTQLVVYDAMPHAHWYMIEIPEAKEALEVQARFLDQHVGR
jgi:monoterpene epsilon-lactone hydrolase